MSNKPKHRRMTKVERVMAEKNADTRKGMRRLFKPFYERSPWTGR